MLKKGLIFSVFSVILLNTYPISVFAASNDYKDVNKNHWAYETLKQLSDKYKLELGFPDGSFKGEKVVTRYEVASIVLKLLEKFDSKKVEKEEIKIIKEISKDYSEDMKSIDSKLYEKVQSLENQMDILETQVEKQMNEANNFMEAFPFQLGGDIGLRYQLTTQKLGEDFQNQVPQVRGSIFLESKDANPFGYGVRLVTGGLNRTVSTWWKLSDFFDKTPLNFDKLFVKYKPSKMFELTLGRFTSPFVNSEIYFSDEITHQGAVQTLKFTDISNSLKEISLNAGELVVNMDKDFGNTFSLNASADMKFNFADFLGLNIKGGYYQYAGLNNLAQANKVAKDKAVDPKLVGNTNTNTLDTTGNFKSEFKIVNGFAKAIFRLSDNLPLTISGDYLYNLGAQADNQAMKLSARLGTLKDVGNFFVEYDFKQLQTDSTLAFFVEDQLGGTDIQAHEGILGIKLSPSTIFSTTFMSKTGIKKTNPATYTIRASLIQSF